VPAYTLKRIETEAGTTTLERKGTRYDYLKIAEEGGRVCWLYNGRDVCRTPILSRGE